MPSSEPAAGVSLHPASPLSSLLPLRWMHQLAVRERGFLVVLGGGFLLAGGVYPQAELARWLGFCIAAYAVVANDSIQTIGTFIASNPRTRWWVLWLFIGGVFLATVAYSFFAYQGDVSHQRLAAKGFATAPTQFSFLQVAAPLFLLLLTRLRVPVSTSILLLTSFADEPSGVGSMLLKSLSGWLVAFVAAYGLWIVLARRMAHWFQGTPARGWRAAQWVTSGSLWAIWVMQDAANVAVYLPRAMSGWEFAAFAGVILAGLALLFYSRGERVQEIVEEKSDVVDVRPATIIDVVYAVILFGFKEISAVPMSTTWVFIGLLGGRELAMATRRTARRGTGAAARLMARDVGYALAGLVVSIAIALSVNDALRAGLFGG